jgi:hypothetical protein
VLSSLLPPASAEEEDDDDAAAAQRTVRVGTQGTCCGDEKPATPRAADMNMPAAIIKRIKSSDGARKDVPEEVVISALQLTVGIIEGEHNLARVLSVGRVDDEGGVGFTLRPLIDFNCSTLQGPACLPSSQICSLQP